MKKILFLLGIVITLSVGLSIKPAHAAIALDATSTSAIVVASATISWTHVVGASANMLTCAINGDPGVSPAATTTGVTANGTPMTLVAQTSSLSLGMPSLWDLPNPSIGSQTILATISTSTQVNGSCASWSGVGSIGSSTVQTGTVTSTSATFTNLASGDVIYDTISVHNSTLNTGINLTLIKTTSLTAANVWTGFGNVSSTSITVGWVITNGAAVHFGQGDMVLIPSGSPPPTSTGFSLITFLTGVLIQLLPGSLITLQ